MFGGSAKLPSTNKWFKKGSFTGFALFPRFLNWAWCSALSPPPALYILVFWKQLQVTSCKFAFSFHINWTKSCFSHEHISVKSIETKHPPPYTRSYNVIVLWSPHTQLLAPLWCVASVLIATISLLSTLIQTFSLSSLTQRQTCRGITLGFLRSRKTMIVLVGTVNVVSVASFSAHTWREKEKNTLLSSELRSSWIS